MNLKLAKALRRQITTWRDARYNAVTHYAHKPLMLQRLQVFLDPHCGRSIYRVLKKVIKKHHGDNPARA